MTRTIPVKYLLQQMQSGWDWIWILGEEKLFQVDQIFNRLHDGTMINNALDIVVFLAGKYVNFRNSLPLYGSQVINIKVKL